VEVLDEPGDVAVGVVDDGVMVVGEPGGEDDLDAEALGGLGEAVLDGAVGVLVGTPGRTWRGTDTFARSEARPVPAASE